MVGRLAAVIGLALCGCGDGQARLDWRVSFDPRDLGERAVAVELTVLEGTCSGAGLHRWHIPRGGSTRVEAVLPRGRYAFRARASDADCTWFAEECQVAALPRPEPVDQRLTALATPRAACEADRCVAGECLFGGLDAGMDGGLAEGGLADTGPPDAGPPDAGPPDTGPPDTGPPDTGPADTGPPDAGPCPEGAECSGGMFGRVGICVAGECCTGCIDIRGTCEPGTAMDACGTAGNDCLPCFPGFWCTGFVCAPDPGSGGM